MTVTEDFDINTDFFTEPVDFRPSSPPPTSHRFNRDLNHIGNSDEPLFFDFSLVGRHSLWAHVAWNAGIVIAHYLDRHKELCHGKTVLELGAGASLPSMICCVNGAEHVVTTDYPDHDLIETLQKNMKNNLASYSNWTATGYLWGSDSMNIKQFLGSEKRFDVIIMCDLVFNHTQHDNMLKTCRECLNDEGIILCAFTHHRPWLAHKDMGIITKAEEFFHVEKLFEQKMNVMFEEDLGDRQVRETVHVYRFTHRPSSLSVIEK